MIDPGVRRRALRVGAVATAAALAALAGCGAGGTPDRAQPWPQRPVVDASLDLAPDLGSATGTESVLLTPDLPVCEIVFRNWANRPTAVADGNSSTITRASVDGTPVDPRIRSAGAPPGAPGTLVELPLPSCVPAGTPIRAEVGFRVTLGAGSAERLGHSPEAGTAWLGSAIPLLAWVRGQGWARDAAVDMYGETATSEDLRLDALDVTVDDDQAVVGTGTATGTRDPAPGRRTHRFTADAIRNVAVSAGNYAITEATAGDVRLHVAVPRSGTNVSAQQWTDQVTRQLTALSDLLGPYPYPDLWLTIVPSQTDGVEFPTALQFADDPADQVPALVAHEIAHQWFYALVGNNQARDPWLDEAFATWAQAVVTGGQNRYRIDDFDVDDDGGIGDPMPAWDSRGDFAGYVNGVYDQGAAALLAGRDRVGSTRFDTAVRAYVAANAHRVATPADVRAAFADLPEVLQILRDHGAFPG